MSKPPPPFAEAAFSPVGTPVVGSLPSSRVATPDVAAAAGPPPPGAGPPLPAAGGPPSRSTSGAAAPSIDDLLDGPPGPRKAGGTIKKGKKGGSRYVDIMAK